MGRVTLFFNCDSSDGVLIAFFIGCNSEGGSTPFEPVIPGGEITLEKVDDLLTVDYPYYSYAAEIKITEIGGVKVTINEVDLQVSQGHLVIFTLDFEGVPFTVDAGNTYNLFFVFSGLCETEWFSSVLITCTGFDSFGNVFSKSLNISEPGIQNLINWELYGKD